MNPETRLVRKILKELRSQGGWWVKIHGSAFQSAGIPDIIGCYLGAFVAIEVKVPGKKGTESPVQELTRTRIMRAGGYIAVVDSVDEAIALIYEVKENTGPW